MTEADSTATTEPMRNMRRTLPRPRVTIALAAFIMSLSVALINAFYALRGPEVLVLPPQQVILYRDGEGPRAVLAVGLPLRMINTAGSGEGDVLMDAKLSPWPQAPAFAANAEISPVFADVPDAKQRCSLDARCISLPGLLIQERPSAIADLPGGSAKLLTFTFPLIPWNCASPSKRCDAFGNFDEAVRQLAGHPLDVTGSLRFYRDGTRRFRCQVGRVDGGYLSRNGWMTASCKTGSVAKRGWW